MAPIHLLLAERYPTRHPVMLKVFEKPEMVIVRSAMPGIVAGLMCSWPPKTKYS